MITGASGYVGARLYYDLSKAKFNVIGTYSTNRLSDQFEQLDITDRDKVKDLIRVNKPEVIIHSAALASSKACDDKPDKAIAINELGTHNIVEAANYFNIPVIYVSATVAEQKHSMYEQTKFKGEELVKGVDAGHVTLRPSVIFGMSPNTETKKPFNQMLGNIEGKASPQELAYDNSWFFQPTWIGHISEIIISLRDRRITNSDKEIPVVVPEMKSKFEIANDILPKFGKNPTISNEKSWRERIRYDLNGLIRLELPTYTYSEIQYKIIDELRDRKSYMKALR